MIAQDTQRLLGSVTNSKSWIKRMSTWVTKQFGGDLEKVEMSIPTIEKPDELLIKVKVGLVFKSIRCSLKLKLCNENFLNFT